MAEERKESWWKSLPGVLTAATGFVAALSGLVAGLNQLGVFRRDQPAPQVATAPVQRDTSGEGQGATVRGTSSSTAPAPQQSGATAATPPSTLVPRAPARAPSRPVMPSEVPTGGPDSTHRAAPGTGPARSPSPPSGAPAAAARLPKGTALELAMPSRTCAPSDGSRRFTARLASPVRAGAETVLPAGTTAVLHLRRAASGEPQARLDSLVGGDLALAAPASTLRLRRESVNGACLRANAHFTAVLGAPLTIPSR